MSTSKADSAPVTDTRIKNAAQKTAAVMAEHIFKDRDGHGGKGDGIGYRQMRRGELEAYLALAYERGAAFGKTL